MDKKERISKKFEEIFEILELSPRDWKKTAERLAHSYLEEIFPSSKKPSLSLYPEPGTKGQFLFFEKIPIHTFCAHHLVPMIGHAKIGYRPSKDAVLGFSKIHELVHFLCQKPQLQEKLTQEIASSLSLVLETEDIAVHTRILHTCMAQKKMSIEASVVDSYLFSGLFEEESIRNSFLLAPKATL